MVVLEGPDGGGKTTLGQLLAQTLGYELRLSEGPEKFPGEIDARILRYAREYTNRKDVIFDRHPCVSQIAYRQIHSQTEPNVELVNDFYRMKPLLIYCRPDPAKVTHTATGEWDTPEYLAKVDAGFEKLMTWYDRWAVWNAHHIYRIGDNVRVIEDLIRAWRRV